MRNPMRTSRSAILLVLLWQNVAVADNNLVRILLDVPDARDLPYLFTNPRDGWIFIARGDAETMRWMKAGKHEVSSSAGKRLLVRAIPEIVYAEIGYRPSPFLESFPRYDVAYLEKVGLF